MVKLCEANRKVLSKLDKTGILHILGPAHYHDEFVAALEMDKEEATPPSHCYRGAGPSRPMLTWPQALALAANLLLVA
ncbi:hypothetical protein FQZ97_1277590 [compost metagenome]